MPLKKLDELLPEERGTIVKLTGPQFLRQRLRSLGIREGKEIIKKRESPFGDPIEVEVMGINISLRKQIAHHIFVDVA
jgi:ferrous iron transport protein A